MFLEYLSIFEQVTNAIFALLSINIIHRDIKLTNLIVEGFIIKLIDFGSAIPTNLESYVNKDDIHLKYRRTRNFFTYF